MIEQPLMHAMVVQSCKQSVSVVMHGRTVL